MGNPFITLEARILKYGLNNDLYSTLTRDGINIIYYYNVNFQAPTIIWYENPEGNMFIDDYGLGTLTKLGSNYIDNKLSRYAFFF